VKENGQGVIKYCKCEPDLLVQVVDIDMWRWSFSLLNYGSLIPMLYFTRPEKKETI